MFDRSYPKIVQQVENTVLGPATIEATSAIRYYGGDKHAINRHAVRDYKVSFPDRVVEVSIDRSCDFFEVLDFTGCAGTGLPAWRPAWPLTLADFWLSTRGYTDAELWRAAEHLAVMEIAKVIQSNW